MRSYLNLDVFRNPLMENFTTGWTALIRIDNFQAVSKLG